MIVKIVISNRETGFRIVITTDEVVITDIP